MDIARDLDRPYRKTHPWIAFRLDLTRAPWTLWNHIGEAHSKCRHLSRTPLPPALAAEMEAVHLARGALASTAIEGNTLSEEQAIAAVEGTLEVPGGQQYLQRELENVVHALAEIEREVHLDGVFEVTPERLCELNRRVLSGLDVEDHVVPGELRTTGIVVGNSYRGAPVEDCEWLLRRLCDWLGGEDFRRDGDDAAKDFASAFLRAAIAHVYIAWIHPFGDGNGRTARLVEFGILASAAVPSVAAHLLSNHYNATRSNYYRQLDRASKSGGDLAPFLDYAAEGFVGQLQRQLDDIHELVLQATWITYVQSLFPDRTVARRRQRDLVLSMPADRFASRAELTTLTPRLTEAYMTKKGKTLSRDLNALETLGLIERGPGGVRARRELMLSFTPRVAGQPGGREDES